MKSVADRVLCASGLPAWFRRRNRQSLLILMYHGVVARALDPACWHMLPVDAFREQLTYVKRNYDVLPLSEALRGLADGTLPERACAITFDDGFANNRTVALPVLQELGCRPRSSSSPGSWGRTRRCGPIVCTSRCNRRRPSPLDAAGMGLGTLSLADADAKADAIDAVLQHCKSLPAPDKDAQLQQLLDTLDVEADPGPFALMTWDDVDAVAKSGLIEFGGHTTRHDLLSRLHDAQVESEVRLSHDQVTRRTGVTPIVLSRIQTGVPRTSMMRAQGGGEGVEPALGGEYGERTRRCALGSVGVAADVYWVRLDAGAVQVGDIGCMGCAAGLTALQFCQSS